VHHIVPHSFLQALARLTQPFLEWAASRYQARLATNLKKYGLRYDDLYDPMMDLVSKGGCKNYGSNSSSCSSTSSGRSSSSNSNSTAGY
jgi:hypothetical protein